jgi:hypothetical protein
VEQEIAWDLEQGVAKKENAAEQSVLLARDRQLLVHGQSSKPNVDPIEIGSDIEKKGKWENPDSQFPDRLLFDEVPRDCATGSHIDLRETG